ncbi:10814_t:CDS:2 [Diversispora eburnea]|uniref:Mediator of RNA polymerase II transcription subunit 11 n=1 Tax=Diversispora eburnea TaxID=1213867 RepID=A0A9N9C472_9GLOM|nr:10814_t:CDS:2 [Diversispora eburnea]
MPSSSIPQSALRIRDLEAIEKLIVELVETAGKAIMEKLTEKLTKTQQEEEFKKLAEKFFALVDNIQVRLRIQFRNMRNMGITSGDIPFFTITYGEEKEYEIWMNAAKIIKKELDNIIVVAGGLGLQDMENDIGMEIDEDDKIIYLHPSIEIDFQENCTTVQENLSTINNNDTDVSSFNKKEWLSLKFQYCVINNKDFTGGNSSDDGDKIESISIEEEKWFLTNENVRKYSEILEKESKWNKVASSPEIVEMKSIKNRDKIILNEK